MEAAAWGPLALIHSYVSKPRVVLPDFQEVLRGPAVVPDPALVSCIPDRHLPCCMIVLSLDCFSTGSLLVELVVGMVVWWLETGFQGY